MPERDAVSVALNDGYVLLAAGLRREPNGRLAADLILRDSTTMLCVGRVALNVPEEVASWAEQAAGIDRPSPDQLAKAVRAYLLPDALASLQNDIKKSPQADELIEIALKPDNPGQGIELFHDPSNEAYATIPIDGHQETWQLRSRSFRQWLAHRYFVSVGRAPSAQAITDAVNVLSGQAIFDGVERQVFTRAASLEDRV